MAIFRLYNDILRQNRAISEVKMAIMGQDYCHSRPSSASHQPHHRWWTLLQPGDDAVCWGNLATSGQEDVVPSRNNATRRGQTLPYSGWKNTLGGKTFWADQLNVWRGNGTLERSIYLKMKNVLKPSGKVNAPIANSYDLNLIKRKVFHSLLNFQIKIFLLSLLLSLFGSLFH